MNKIVSLIIFTCCFSFAAHSFEPAKLDQYLEAIEVNQKAMLSVAVIKNGEPIYQKSIGFADVQSAQQANKDTQYRIGSITKVFTATMIFQLIEEGKLRLDTKLSEFYPKVKNAESITISMLLNHRSGIYNFTDMPEYSDYMTQPKEKTEMINLIEDLDSDFEPNSKASYSNSGYVLLGFVIEDITSDSYANQLQKRIVEQLNLKRTAYGSVITASDNQAKSYTYSGREWILSTETDMSIPHGAGAISSTPTDVGIFLSSLMTGKLVSADSLAKMTELNQDFGRGLFQFPFHDKKAFGHSGGIDGFRSLAGYFEADDVAFALTSNGMNYVMNDITIAILSSYFGQAFDIPNFDQKAVELSEEALGQYEGLFASDALPLKITIQVIDGELTAQATGQRALTLTPYSTSEFRFDPAGIVMIFATDGEMVDYSTFQLKQGGGNFKFTRK